MSQDATSAIFFDALGTLFSLTPPHTIFSNVMTSLGYTLGEDEATHLLARANEWWLDPTRTPARTRTEELQERQVYVRTFLEEAGRTDDPELERQLVEQTYWPFWVKPYPDVLPALETLQGKVCLAVLSNGGPSVLDAVREVGFEHFFEQMSAGLDVGVQKPDPAAFVSAAERMDIAPEAGLLVDDTPQNVEGARAAGMQAVLLDRSVQFPELAEDSIITLERLPALIG